MSFLYEWFVLKIKWNIYPEHKVPAHIKNSLPARNGVYNSIFKPAKMALISSVREITTDQVNTEKCFIFIDYIRTDTGIE